MRKTQQLAYIVLKIFIVRTFEIFYSYFKNTLLCRLLLTKTPVFSLPIYMIPFDKALSTVSSLSLQS